MKLDSRIVFIVSSAQIAHLLLPKKISATPTSPTSAHPTLYSRTGSGIDDVARQLDIHKLWGPLDLSIRSVLD